MGLLDGLLGGRGGGGGGDAALIQALLGALTGGGQEGGGLPRLVRSFQDAGLGELISSWIGTGENLPVSPEQVKRGFGPDLLSRISAKAGMSEDDAAGGLSGILPGLIDRLTPGGQMPDPAGLLQKPGFLDDILPKK